MDSLPRLGKIPSLPHADRPRCRRVTPIISTGPQRTQPQRLPSHLCPMRIVFFTGAGISAESGLNTFRDNGGLWEQYRVEDVATPEAFARNPALVLRLYDQRRKQVMNAKPNAAHLAIAGVEDNAEVHVVTQNVDDLHERAGSTRVLHLHGEILKARSTLNPTIILPVEGDGLRLGDLCPLGSQLRPHIVWFGEEVPLLDEAASIVARADVLVVVGSSLQVWPAAGLLHAARPETHVHVVDPHAADLPVPPRSRPGGITYWKQKASMGMPMLAEHLRMQAG